MGLVANNERISEEYDDLALRLIDLVIDREDYSQNQVDKALEYMRADTFWLKIGLPAVDEMSAWIKAAFQEAADDRMIEEELRA